MIPDAYYEINKGYCSHCTYMFQGTTLALKEASCSRCMKTNVVASPFSCSHRYCSYCYYGKYYFDEFIVTEPVFPYSDSIREQYNLDYTLFKEDERIYQYEEECDLFEYNQASGLTQRPTCILCKK